MSFARKMKRRNKPRTTCPRCHRKLIEKPGYGILICADCGYEQKKPEFVEKADKP